MSRTSVVVADDESIIRMDLTETLTNAGYYVVGQAAEGQAALDAIQAHKPDVAVLDIKMPLLDGIEVARAVRHEVPVVLLTAFGQSDIVAQASDAGAMGYLVKPFTDTEVIATIEIAIRRFADVRAITQERDELAITLQTRKLMDRAKGLLQKHMNLSEPDAFRWIQKAAMDKRTSASAIAEDIISRLAKK